MSGSPTPSPSELSTSAWTRSTTRCASASRRLPFAVTVDDPGPPVGAGGATLSQAGGLELVEHDHHRRLVHADGAGELDLGEVPFGGGPQGAHVARGQVERASSAAVVSVASTWLAWASSQPRSPARHVGARLGRVSVRAAPVSW